MPYYYKPLISLYFNTTPKKLNEVCIDMCHFGKHLSLCQCEICFNTLMIIYEVRLTCYKHLCAATPASLYGNARGGLSHGSLGHYGIDGCFNNLSVSF